MKRLLLLVMMCASMTTRAGNGVERDLIDFTGFELPRYLKQKLNLELTKACPVLMDVSAPLKIAEHRVIDSSFTLVLHHSAAGEDLQRRIVIKLKLRPATGPHPKAYELELIELEPTVTCGL